MVGTAAAAVLANVKSEAEVVEDEDKKKQQKDEDRDSEWLPPTNQHGVKGGKIFRKMAPALILNGNPVVW